MDKQNSVCGRILWAGLSVILLLIPFHALLTAFFASHIGHFDLLRLWKEAILTVLVPVAVVAVVKDKTTYSRLKTSWIARLSGLFLALIILMTVTGFISGSVSFKAAVYGFIIDSRIILIMFVAWVATQNMPAKKDWSRLVLLPAIVVVAFGVLQMSALPHDFLRHLGYGPATLPAYQSVDNKPDLVRIQSSLRGPNPLGAYLVPVIILFVAGLIHNKKQRLHYGLCLVGGLVIMYGSYSRSAWLGLAVASWCFVLWSVKTQQKRTFWLATSVLVVFLGAFVIGFRHNNSAQDIFFHTSAASTSPYSSNQQRAKALKDGLRDIVHHPFGHGVGGSGPASVRNSSGGVSIPENFLIQIGQEVGILGLIMFVGLLGAIGQALWSMRSKTQPLVVLASLVGLIIVNMVSHAWADDTLAYVFFGLTGLTLAKISTKSENPAKLT